MVRLLDVLAAREPCLCLYIGTCVFACLLKGATSQAAENAPCPCADPFSDTTLLSEVSSGDCLQSVSDCYPLDYGSTCFEWDATSKPCIGIEVPPWCTSAWCYVDPDTCERPHSISTLWNLSRPVAFSYATCGSLNHYSSVDFVSTLQRRTLRITYPAIIPPEVVQGSDGAWTGSFVEFTREIWHELGINPK
eukprot:2159378-Amphidinium_carterae.1